MTLSGVALRTPPPNGGHFCFRCKELFVQLTTNNYTRNPGCGIIRFCNTMFSKIEKLTYVDLKLATIGPSGFKMVKMQKVLLTFDSAK